MTDSKHPTPPPPAASVPVLTDERIDELGHAYQWFDADVERWDHRGFARAIAAEVQKPAAQVVGARRAALIEAAALVLPKNPESDWTEFARSNALCAERILALATQPAEQIVRLLERTYTHTEVRAMLHGISSDAARHGLEVVDHMNGSIGLRVQPAEPPTAQPISEREAVIEECAQLCEQWDDADILERWSGPGNRPTLGRNKVIAFARAIIAADRERQAVQGWQHVAYAEDGVLHWTSGRKFQNCELYTESPQPGEAT